MIGVVVDRKDWVIICGVNGYRPNVNPIKFPKDCDTMFSCGVVGANGKFQVDPTFEYPRINACASVGIAYRFS